MENESCHPGVAWMLCSTWVWGKWRHRHLWGQPLEVGGGQRAEEGQSQAAAHVGRLLAVKPVMKKLLVCLLHCNVWCLVWAGKIVFLVCLFVPAPPRNICLLGGHTHTRLSCRSPVEMAICLPRDEVVSKKCLKPPSQIT